MHFKDYLDIISEIVNDAIKEHKVGFLTSTEERTVLTVCDEILSYAEGISTLRDYAEAD